MQTKESKRAKQHFWHQHVMEQGRSGLIASEYCRRYNLNHKMFSAYKCKQAQDNSHSTVSQSVFMPLITKPTESFTVKLKSGTELTFDKAPAPEWLAALLGKLGDGHDQHTIV